MFSEVKRTDHTFVDIQLSHWLPLSENYLIGSNNKVVKVHIKHFIDIAGEFQKRGKKAHTRSFEINIVESEAETV
jgi:hypothetical protein